MITANQFFQDTNAVGQEEEHPSRTTDRFSRWRRISNASWRLERLANAPVSTHPPQAVLDSMNRLLTHHSVGTAQHDHVHQDQFVLDMEAFLNAKQNTAASIHQDRQGVVVSSPLRLSTKTISKGLLTVSNSTNDDPFCMVAMAPNNNISSSSGVVMEFASYAKKIKHNLQSYIPVGYEEFEALRQQKQSDGDNEHSSSTLYYIMEIKARGETEGEMILGAGTTLEDVYLILGDDSSSNGSNGNPQDQSTASVGVKAKVISSQRWVQMLRDDPRDDNEEDLTWVFRELEDMPPMSLPQPVGANSCQGDNNGSDKSSLLLVVSLDEKSMNQLNSYSQSSADENAEKTITRGNLVLKFRRTALIRYSPMESQLSTAHFAIARSVQMVQYPSTEQDKVRKALEGALWNAERFIPEQKRQQWDGFPDVIICVVPHPALPFILSRWLQNPLSRKSNFDLAPCNLLMRLPYWQRYSPRDCPYIDLRWHFNEHVWMDLASARADLEQNVKAVKKSSIYHQSQRTSDAIEFDAKGLQQLCCDVEEAGSFLSRHELLRQGYVRRMLAALDIERLHCFEDIKKHDLYSVHWKGHTVEIPPPMTVSKFCPKCNPSGNFRGPNGLNCMYHMASVFYEDEFGKSPPPGKPIAIRSKSQIERLPRLLAMFPGESLIVKITVPGVAEDFPLISIGDLVRLYFRSPGDELKTEIIGEVADVVVKSEEVTIRLPSPYQRNSAITMGCFPYLQAILHTKDYVVDARAILQSGLPMSIDAIPITDQNRKELLDRLRFDVRFGFQGFRGFHIIQQTLRTFFYTPDVDQFIQVGMRKDKKKVALNRVKAENVEHWCRVLTPTKANDDHIVPVSDLKLPSNPEAPPPLKFVTSVNPEQQRAVTNIAYRNHGHAPYILQGPAGTGKSMCVCEGILQVLRVFPGAKILVCAPSDAACDVLASRLIALKHPKSILRINWWSRKVASVKPELLPSCPVDVLSGVFTVPSLEHLQRVDVVVCQCFVAECLDLVGQRGWTRSHFTHLFIDETSQAMECEALVPISKVGPRCSIVLAGDPKQLGPTIRNPVAASMGLGMSILERLSKLPLYASKRYCVNTQLVRNYRSNDALLTVPSSLFYGGSLKCYAPKAVTDPFENWGDLGAARFPLLLCNVSNGKERSKIDTPSFYNLEECHAIIALAKGLLRCKCKEGVEQLHTGQICVITPFRAQVLAMRLLLRNANIGGVSVGVVEDFQGQEAKVVFISTVLTRDHQRWNRSAVSSDGDKDGEVRGQQRFGFLHDPKRFNVAITRAHALCIVVGNANYLEQSGTYWSALMDHIKRNDGVLGAGGTSNSGDADPESNDDDQDDDAYGVDDLLRRVEELRLLGCGVEEDIHDLSHYYSDIPQWKVMLS